MSRPAPTGDVEPVSAWRVLRYARTGRVGVAGLAALGAAQALTTLLVIGGVTALVVHLAEDLPAIGGQDRLGPLARPGTALVVVGLAFAARAGLTWAEQVLARRTAARVARDLRIAVLAASLRRGPAWVARFGTGRLVTLTGAGLDALLPWFTGYLPALTLAVVLVPLVVVLLFAVDPASGLVAVLTLPLVPVFGALVGMATAQRARERWVASTRLEGHFLDAVRGLATLRLFGRAQRQVAVVARMSEFHRAAGMRLLRLAFLSTTALDLVATGSVGIIAVGAGLRVAAGDLDLTGALLAILLAPEAYRPLREVAAQYHASAQAGAVIGEVDEVLTSTTGNPSPANGIGPAEPSATAEGLRVRHPGTGRDALRLSGRLDVAAGEIVALAGPSGAGKTTALRVLAGLQPVDSGGVRRTGPRPLYLPQHPVLPHARTVRDALLLDHEIVSAPPEQDRKDRAEGADSADRAARDCGRDLAEALAWVGLEVDLRTPLGEFGGGLSSGQRQRLALARVLRAARREPAVLLLDEPTAHLDPATERLVVEELVAAARRGCAVLVVTHRPHLLASADRVVHLLPVGGLLTGSPPVTGVEPVSNSPDSGRDGWGAGNERARVRGATVKGATVLGAGSWLAGIALTGAATWLLVRASQLPPVLTLSTAVVVVRASAVTRPLLRYLERLAAHDTGLARLGEWRSQVYAGLVRAGHRRVGRRGELLTRVVDDVDTRVDGLLRGRLPARSAVLAAGTALVTAGLVLPWPVALPLLAAVAPGLLLTAAVAPWLAGRWATRTDAAVEQAGSLLSEAVVETVEGLDELAGRDPAAALRVPAGRVAGLDRAAASSTGRTSAAAALARAGAGLTVLGAAVAVLDAVAAGRLGPETAAVVLLSALALTEPLLTLPDAAVARARGRAAVSRLERLTHEPVTNPVPRPEVRRDGDGAVPEQCGCIVRGLVAGWEPGTPVLRGLDLHLAPGARVAVLGRSGSGKSTLAAVLAGLTEPLAGRVEAGRVALVGDEVDHVFAATVRENLLVARPGAGDDELVAVLESVRLGAWLAGLPDGLGTWLGEAGGTVSGGERRRLVTARALLRDPDLLVLDEPTEGLDAPTARLLMADLMAATDVTDVTERGRRRSVLLLTHRPEGLREADAVLVLESGRLHPTVDAADLGGTVSGESGRPKPHTSSPRGPLCPL